MTAPRNIPDAGMDNWQPEQDHASEAAINAAITAGAIATDSQERSVIRAAQDAAQAGYIDDLCCATPEQIAQGIAAHALDMARRTPPRRRWFDGPWIPE